MAKKWKFILTIVEDSDTAPDLDKYFPDEANVADDGKVLQFEVTKLSPWKFQSLTDDELKNLLDWNSVENPMQLYSYIEKVGDANTLSFQVKWGRISTYLLKANAQAAEFSLAILSVEKLFADSSKKKKKKQNESDTSQALLEIAMLEAEMVGGGHFVKTGHDWFSLKFDKAVQTFM